MKKFTGIGTVFISDIINVDKLAEYCGPEDFIKVLSEHIKHVCAIVEKHSGIILQYEGDVVSAFWHPHHTNPSHAQLAFDASCEVLALLPELVARQNHVAYDLDIVLGTGEMTGDVFGPIKQFQVVGKAVAVAERLSKARALHGSSIRMSQYTVDLIRSRKGIEETGSISRDNSEDLRIFTYCSANNSLQRTR